MSSPKPKPRQPEATRTRVRDRALGGAVALLSGCAGSSSNAGEGAPLWSGGAPGGGGAAAGGNGGSGGGSSACTFYPQQTEGPFYLDLDLLRADVTEGKPGTPLVLAVVVQRGSDCQPLANVAVDIRHCDAGGVYRATPGSSVVSTPAVRSFCAAPA
ncbi:MAG: hypothetical protein U0263_40965 [Polyangiaceae bacterium]